MINGHRHRFDWANLTPSAIIDLGATHTNGTTTIIENKSFTNLSGGTMFGSCIAGVWSEGDEGTGNIIIRNCYFGPSAGEAIQTEWFGTSESHKLVVENCLFANNKNGVFVAFSICGLSIHHNQFMNPHGARGGKGQAVQLSNTLAPNGRIYANRIESFIGEGYTEDMISVYVSGGSSGNPLIVSGNFSRGGGPSDSGGGFIIGDTGGEYAITEKNKILDPGNYTLAIAGGNNNIVRDNLGYSAVEWGSWISCYVYKVDTGGPACSNHTMQNNNVFLGDPGNYYYGGDHGAEDCGAVTGCPGDDFTSGNTTGLSLATLDFPTTLIDLVPEDIQRQLRKESTQFRVETIEGGWPASLPRPTANSEADKGISIDNTTINSTGSTGGTIYLWKLIKGPNNTSNGLGMTNTTTATLSVTGMIDGVYRFRLDYSNAAGAMDFDWTTVTVTLV